MTSIVKFLLVTNKSAISNLHNSRPFVYGRQCSWKFETSKDWDLKNELDEFLKYDMLCFVVLSVKVVPWISGVVDIMSSLWSSNVV